MPRRSILSATERESLLALPDTKDELIRLYTFSDTDLSRHSAASWRRQIGWASPCSFATCAFRASRSLLTRNPIASLLRMVADQLKLSSDMLERLRPARRNAARASGWSCSQPIGFQVVHDTESLPGMPCIAWTDLALQTDKGIVLAATLVEDLRRKQSFCCQR